MSPITDLNNFFEILGNVIYFTLVILLSVGNVVSISDVKSLIFLISQKKIEIYCRENQRH